jgi:hypothetical protein
MEVVLLAKDPIVDKYDLRSLKVINSSAAPLKEDLLLATHKRLNIPVQQGTLSSNKTNRRLRHDRNCAHGNNTALGRLETCGYV